jgi:hypothetical protein
MVRTLETLKQTRIRVSERLPRPLQRVSVVCSSVQCVRYIDAKEVRHYDWDGKEIPTAQRTGWGEHPIS